ncbi:MAG: hypothetical protein PHO42_06365 [Candidatus Omnitrophica bacterium]|nr:hypothetical protein [Candidatus Omnitrophota bacterium]
MDDAVISVNTKNIEKLFKNAPRVFKRELANALDHISRKFLKKFYTERLSGAPGLLAKRGGIFHRFRRVVITSKDEAKFLDIHASQSETTGAIAKATKNPLDMRVEIYTKSKVAGVYERGGSISGGQRMLRVPLSNEAKERSSKDPIQGLVILYTPKGLFLVQKISIRKLIFHYILKHSVPITRRLGFIDTWNEMEGERVEILDDAVNEAIAKS